MSTKSPNPIDKYVGGRVRMRRLMIGMSQEALANQLGLTFQQVQKYEKGTNRVGAGRLPQIAQIFDIPIGSLLAAAIATRCALGDTLPAAIVAARAFVRAKIAAGVEFAGMRIAP